VERGEEVGAGGEREWCGGKCRNREGEASSPLFLPFLEKTDGKLDN
jgi:hypothetical protein